MKYGFFEQHLRDAIVINRQRAAAYVALAGWPARLLAFLLIGSEWLTLPLARYFDRRARPFNQAGIPVVQNDFVDMADIRPQDAPPLYRSQASRAQRKQLRQALITLQRTTLPLLDKHAFSELADEVAATLRYVQTLEQQAQCHFAMTVHLLESLGLAAFNATAYVRADAACLPLCRQLVGIQLRLLTGGLVYDRLAQRCHIRGAAVVLNDVPHIPFLSHWQQSRFNKGT